MSCRLAFIAFVLLANSQAVLAQPHRPGPGGPGFEDRRAAREEMRRERMERREGRQDERAGDRDHRQQRMSPDERRELRRQIRDHGQDIYRR
ncbi:MAG: hypothetical protein ACKVQQ_03155 [Burkholderiales bacterium]